MSLTRKNKAEIETRQFKNYDEAAIYISKWTLRYYEMNLLCEFPDKKILYQRLISTDERKMIDKYIKINGHQSISNFEFNFFRGFKVIGNTIDVIDCQNKITYIKAESDNDAGIYYELKLFNEALAGRCLEDCTQEVISLENYLYQKFSDLIDDIKEEMPGDYSFSSTINNNKITINCKTTSSDLDPDTLGEAIFLIYLQLENYIKIFKLSDNLKIDYTEADEYLSINLLGNTNILSLNRLSDCIENNEIKTHELPVNAMGRF